MIKFEQSQKKEKYIFSKSRNIILLLRYQRTGPQKLFPGNTMILHSKFHLENSAFIE